MRPSSVQSLRPNWDHLNPPDVCYPNIISIFLYDLCFSTLSCLQRPTIGCCACIINNYLPLYSHWEILRKITCECWRRNTMVHLLGAFVILSLIQKHVALKILCKVKLLRHSWFILSDWGKRGCLGNVTILTTHLTLWRWTRLTASRRRKKNWRQF